MTIKELKECTDHNRKVYHSRLGKTFCIYYETYSNTQDSVLIQFENSTTEIRVQLDDLLVL